MGDPGVGGPPRVAVGGRAGDGAADDVDMGELREQAVRVAAGCRGHGDVQRELLAAPGAQPAAEGDAAAVFAAQPDIDGVQEVTVVDPDPAGPEPRHHVAVAVPGDTHMRTAELAGPEVAAGLRLGGVVRVREAAGAVERHAGRPGAVDPGVLGDAVDIGVGGDGEELALGQHRVPESADRRRRPVEAAVGDVGLARIARPGVGGRLVGVLAADVGRRVPAGDRSGLRTGCAFHPDHDLGRRVAPGAQFVRGVDAEPHRVVGQDQYVVDIAGTALLGEPLEGLDRVRLVAEGVGVRGPAGGVAEQLSVVRRLEAGEQVDLVPSGRGEDGAVFGTGDVPLQTLEDQHALVPRPGLEDLVVFLMRAELGVTDVAVLGEDHPVEPEPPPGGGQLGEGVLGVVAVDGVVVVVTDQIGQFRITAAVAMAVPVPAMTAASATAVTSAPAGRLSR
ncbi:hypothetical protein ACVWXU_007922 [Streptomyces sp. TE33382]